MSTTTHSTKYEHTFASKSAERLAKQGYRVFPLRPNAKVPLIKRWPERATSDVQAIRQWWGDLPTANIGIATGHGLAVIDVDPRHGGTVDPRWPATATVRTPSGGTHLYYSCSTPIRNSAGKLAPGVDVRGEGGFVVAAGSRIDGGTYEWQPPQRGIATVPASMFAPTVARTTANGQPHERFAQRERVAEGGRNDYLASYAGWLLRIGYPSHEVEQHLQIENGAVCVPPLDADEVERIADSIAKTHEARQ